MIQTGADLKTNSVRSFRELPMRMAEFGVLHRNEVSGSLTGGFVHI